MMGDKTVLILGAGGHAKVLIEALLRNGTAVAGILDRDPAMKGSSIMTIPVLGNDDALAGCDPREVLLVNGMGSIALPLGRQKLYERIKERGFHFTSVIHPFAVVASDASMGEGVQLMAGCVIQPGCTIGANCIVNTRASVDHDCKIGDHVHVAPGVTLSGEVQVGEGVHIGTGATVIQGVTIGKSSLIAAGAVVVHHVREYSTVMGVPAKESRQ